MISVNNSQTYPDDFNKLYNVICDQIIDDNCVLVMFFPETTKTLLAVMERLRAAYQHQVDVKDNLKKCQEIRVKELNDKIKALEEKLNDYEQHIPTSSALDGRYDYKFNGATFTALGQTTPHHEGMLMNPSHAMAHINLLKDMWQSAEKSHKNLLNDLSALRKQNIVLTEQNKGLRRKIEKISEKLRLCTGCFR